MNTLRTLAMALASVLVLAGCKSKKAGVPLPLEQQSAYLAMAKPPQQFGFTAFKTGEGIACSGTCRLHPRHTAKAKMIKGDIPAIKMMGESRTYTLNVLLDFSSPVSWIEFSKSRELGAHFLGVNKTVIPYRGDLNTGGNNAFASIVTRLRIDQLFIEDLPFYTVMATGSLGPLVRGIYSPKIDAILGYDNLRVFEAIQIDAEKKQIFFSATTPYTPGNSPTTLRARIVKKSGSGLAVMGSVSGEPTPILLDFAGNFDFARGDVKVSSTDTVTLGDLALADVPTLVLPENSSLPRIGRKILSNYVVTICSKQGVVYFDRYPEK